MATGVSDAPPLGCTWDEIDAEGIQFLIHGKKHIAFDTFNKAAETDGCGWPVFAHRADCKLRLLDFPGALNDAVQALDMHAQEQREQRPYEEPLPQPAAPLATAADALWREAEMEDALVLASRLSARRAWQSGLLIGDERAQRVEGLRADIRNAMGPPVGRVLRRDLIRAMMRHKGINPKRLTAGQRLSWVTVSSIQADPPPQDAVVDTPLPLPIIWGALPWTEQPSDTEEEEEEEEEEEVDENEVQQSEEKGDASDKEDEEGKDEGVKEEPPEHEQAEESMEVEKDTEAAEVTETEEKAAETEEKTPAASQEQGDQEDERRLKTKVSVEGPRWGWLKQIPGHDHICADPLVAAQADRIAELRVLGILERDRAYLRWLLGEMQSVQERPGERRQDCGCPPCPGPNLAKWKDSELRAEEMDEKQDPLALSKWEAQDLCRKTIGDINHMVRAELRCKPRYLHPTAARGPSPQMRAARSEARRERALSTVRFMMRRLHGSLGAKQYRDVEQVGERLTTFLERLPCRIFPDRLDALARTLDCRAVGARRRNNSKLAIEMQKRRCALAVNHGLSALYARALDEVALLLFSVADYPLAETSWNERLARLQQQPQEEVREEKGQVLFQLARCCFVQGYLRMAGPKGTKQAESSKKDHRSDLPEFTMSLGRTSSSDVGDMSVKRSQSSAEAEEAQAVDGKEEMYEDDWRGACRWTVDLLGYDLGSPDGENEIPDTSNVELKPNCVEACLRIAMEELGTKDPLNEYAHLVAVERYPDAEDAARTYPLMPPDFDLEDNIMNKEYEAFEGRFRDACHFFVCNITGVSPFPQPEAEAAPEAAPEAAEPNVPAKEGGGGPAAAAEPETDRLPSVTEEPEDPAPPPGTEN